MSLQDGIDDSPDLLAEDQEHRQVRRKTLSVSSANRHVLSQDSYTTANSEVYDNEIEFTCWAYIGVLRTVPYRAERLNCVNA